jgi:predicted DNA-binding transcriptional regulator AlpA
MLKKLPRRTPPLADMISDLSATPAQVAQALHVDKSTIYRWLTVGKAPRCAELSIYWLTRWGQSEIDTEMWNAANVYRGFAYALERENMQLREDVARLLQLGEYGSANDPINGSIARYGLDGANKNGSIRR